MEFIQPVSSPVADDVFVFVGNHKGVKQPKTFHLCPLGLQFYSDKRLEDFTLLEFNLMIPGPGRLKKKVTCIGAVVRCQAEKKKGAYRVWIKFLDMPPAARESIRCVSKNGKHLCCFCENF